MAEKQEQLLKVLQGVQEGKKRTHKFHLDFTEDYGDEFEGWFTVHHPTQLENLRIGLLQSQITGGIPPMDQRTDNLVLILATLDVVLDDKPTWFDASNPDLEYEMLETVYLEYLKWVDNFRKSRKRVNDGADNGNNESEATVLDNEGVEGTTN